MHIIGEKISRYHILTASIREHDSLVYCTCAFSYNHREPINLAGFYTLVFILLRSIVTFRSGLSFSLSITIMPFEPPSENVTLATIFKVVNVM